MENKYMRPMCALVRSGNLNVLYVATDGHELFCSSVVARHPELVITPDVNLDFIALRGNGNKGCFFVVNVRYDHDGGAFVAQGLVQAVDEDEAYDIVVRAGEQGLLDGNATVRDVMECNGESFPGIDAVKLCECFGECGNPEMYVYAFGSENDGRRLFGKCANPTADDFMYLFNDGAVPAQLWPLDNCKYGCMVEHESLTSDEHDE